MDKNHSAADTGAAANADTVDLDPRDTDHPAGEQHAAENAANDPPA